MPPVKTYITHAAPCFSQGHFCHNIRAFQTDINKIPLSTLQYLPGLYLGELKIKQLQHHADGYLKLRLYRHIGLTLRTEIGKTMNGIYPVLFIASSLIISSCSIQEISEAGYSVGQSYQQGECRKGPPSQFDECMEQASMSYEEYKNEREKLFND